MFESVDRIVLCLGLAMAIAALLPMFTRTG
jgi:hypothetical protein